MAQEKKRASVRRGKVAARSKRAVAKKTAKRSVVKAGVDEDRESFERAFKKIFPRRPAPPKSK